MADSEQPNSTYEKATDETGEPFFLLCCIVHSTLQFLGKKFTLLKTKKLKILLCTRSFHDILPNSHNSETLQSNSLMSLMLLKRTSLLVVNSS